MKWRAVVAAVIAALFVGCGASEADAWPYREVTEPQGSSSGTVLYFHAGGWKGGAEKVKRERYAIRPFVRAGWTAWSVDYRTGYALRDARRWYSRANEEQGPLCVAGASSGAHLALLLAAKRDPACVVADGAPTDLDALPEHSRRLAVEAFGEDRLEELSPLALSDRIHSPVVLGHYRDDEVVPIRQARAMKRAVDARLQTLDGPGPKPFVHAFEGVERDDFGFHNQLIRRHLRRAEAGP